MYVCESACASICVYRCACLSLSVRLSAYLNIMSMYTRKRQAVTKTERCVCVGWACSLRQTELIFNSLIQVKNRPSYMTMLGGFLKKCRFFFFFKVGGQGCVCRDKRGLTVRV